MRRFSLELQHALAAEYVLGTLRGRARARFEAIARADSALAAVVRGWEDYLTPLAETLAPVVPPERVWRNIEARLGERVAPGAPSLWASLGFWRLLGGALTVAVVALVATIAGRPTAPEAPAMVAVLATPEQDPRMIVERHTGMLKVRMVKPWKTMDKEDLELWVVPKDGKPRSLGVVAYDRDSEVRVADLDVKLHEGVAFAVSREPKGGSASGAPTGPVLCSGLIARATRA